MKIARLWCGVLALVFGSIFPGARLYATSLSSLFDGQTITANDKLFNAFTLTTLQTTNGGAADTTQIDVSPLTDDPLDPGIRFNAPVGALGTPFGHTGPSSVLLTFSFNVSTISGLPLIKDNSLLINGFTFDSSQLASIQVSEQVFDALGNLLGTKQVLATNPSQIGDPSLFDSITFSPQSSVHVVKQIVISGPNDNDGAFLTTFEQRFSQVPEPPVLSLAGILMAVVSVARGVRHRIRSVGNHWKGRGTGLCASVDC